MAYSDFSLSGVKKQFQLDLVEIPNLFEPITCLEPSNFLTDIIQENIPLALASNTEKARSEMIISLILIDLRRQFNRKISLFSGVNFNVESQQGLNGNCDFIISLSEELLIVNAPVITLVEAKKEDLNGGLGQCIAEMLAAQLFNEREQNPISIALRITVRTFLNPETLSLLTVPCEALSLSKCSLFPVPLRVALYNLWGRHVRNQLEIFKASRKASFY